MLEAEKTKITKQLLSSIAYHLAGRKECKGVEYKVKISSFSNTITLNPPIQVYPNRYKRHEIDKVNVITHVVMEHFPNLYLGSHDSLKLYIDTTRLVSGTYIYQSSVDKKRRRWVRIY